MLAGSTKNQGIPGVTDGPIARPGGVSQSSHVRTAVMPLGAVPYDDLSLPLVSPDGMYLVSQTGYPPTWPTLRAEPSAEVPIDTQLAIYRIDFKPNQQGIGRTVLQSYVDAPALLGRACNEQGFLFESPRDDGSRWIGLCHWSSGDIEWLVTGLDVNAFATINRDGDLAWSRRRSGSTNWEVVVRSNTGVELILATPDENWLFPTWGQQRDRLFAFHLHNRELSATYHSLASESALNRPLYQLPLAVQATIDTAYQSLAPHPTSTAAPRRNTDQLTFFHPVKARTVIWQPLESAQQQTIVVPGDSISALLDDSRYALVTTSDHLVRQNLMVPQERQEILAGLLIARPTTNPNWPYVLLSPSRPGQIGLTALNLLPITGGP